MFTAVQTLVFIGVFGEPVGNYSAPIQMIALIAGFWPHKHAEYFILSAPGRSASSRREEREAASSCASVSVGHSRHPVPAQNALAGSRRVPLG